MQHYKVAGTHLHLLFEAIDLRAQWVGAVQSLHTGLGAYDGVEEDDGPKAATDTVKE